MNKKKSEILDEEKKKRSNIYFAGKKLDLGENDVKERSRSREVKNIKDISVKEAEK